MAVIATPGSGNLSNFGGVSGFGMPTTGGAPLSVFGTYYFVDGNLGADGNVGTSVTAPLKTMAEAFTRITSGDVIVFRGNIAEQVSTPAGVFDVTIIGGANRPRHADAHTGNNGYSSSTWKAPSSPTAATPLLTIRQQGWRLINFLLDGPSDAAAVQLFRDAGAASAERDGSHAHFIGCKFVAGQNHIEFKGGLSQVRIEDCTFFGATADSLLETTGAGVGTNNYFEILNNRFHDNASHIDVGLNFATVRGNTFGKFTTAGVDLTGGSYNAVSANHMFGDYDAGYVAGSNDDWAGNFSMDVASAEVGAEGITIAVPVA